MQRNLITPQTSGNSFAANQWYFYGFTFFSIAQEAGGATV
jgi:hypothetical protein